MRWLIRNVRFAQRLTNILLKHAVPLDPQDEYEPDETYGFVLEHGHTEGHDTLKPEGPFMHFSGERSWYIVSFPNIFGGITCGESEHSIVFGICHSVHPDKAALNISIRYELGTCWALELWVFEDTPETKLIQKELAKLVTELESKERLPPDVGEYETDPEDEEPSTLENPLTGYYSLEGQAALNTLEFLRDSFIRLNKPSED